MSTSNDQSNKSFRGEGEDDEISDSKNKHVAGINQEKLEILKSMCLEVNWQIENERHEFLRILDCLIGDWQGQLPDLRDIFRKEEIDWLLLQSVSDMDGEDEIPPFIEFVARSGYKDEPDLDEDGKPILRRTTALHEAFSRGEDIVVPILFKIYDRFDVNYIEEDGLTHFHVACRHGCDDVVKKFLELGVDPNCPEQGTDNLPLHLALINNNERVFELLLRGGANSNFVHDDGGSCTPLHLICDMEDDRDDLVKILFEISEEKHQQVQVDAQNIAGNTPLHWALVNNNVKIAELLLRRGADPNLANYEEETALHILCRVGYDDPDLVEMILELSHDMNRPVQIDAENGEGDTPFPLALLHNTPEVAKCLLKRGANQNFTNKKGFTPLHIICKDDCEDDVVQVYFDICDEFNRPVVVDANDSEGRTPLQLAVANLRPNAVDALLNHGADLSNFVFPNESYFGKELETISRDNCFITIVATKLRNATHLLPVINRLEKAGYELDRDDKLTVVKFFVKYEVLEKSRNLEQYNWFDDEEFLAKAKNIMVKPDLSFCDVMQLPPRQAEKLLALTRYYGVAKTFEGFQELTKRQKEAFIMHLCEKATRRLFQRWALDPFWELIHYRLPIECCEMILDELENEDLCNIFFARVGQS